MYTAHIDMSSGHSAAEALAEALGAAMQMGGEAVSVHVLVGGVVKAGNRWTASVDVIVEPKKVMPKPEAEGPHPRAETKKEDEKKRMELKAFEEREFREKRNFEEKQRQEEYYNSLRAAEARAMQQENLVNDALFHLFLQSEHERMYHEIADKFTFDYVHVIAEGSLWDAAKKYHPDIDMYEASHPAPEPRTQTGAPAPVYIRAPEGPQPGYGGNSGSTEEEAA